MSQLAIVGPNPHSGGLRQHPVNSRRIRRMCRTSVLGSRRRVARLMQAPVACAMCYFGLAISAIAQEPADPAVVPISSEGPLARPEAEILFRELLGGEDYSAAVPIAERLLEIALEESGTRSIETGEALFELGSTQRLAGLFEEAELSFLNAIEVYRAVDGQFSERIIAPSVGLGDAYYDDGQFTNAVAAYNEARTIQRRALGLLSEGQLTIMDRLTRSFQALSMGEEADEQQRAAMTMIERIYGVGDIETLEAIYKYGAWLRSVYRYDDERQQYERAIRIIRDEYGKDHPLLIRPYREIGNSFRTQGFESPRGASALNSALELLEGETDADQLEIARAIIDVGDWRTAFGSHGGGQEEYLRAWNMLGASPELRAARTELLQPRRARAVLSQGMSIRGLAQDPNDPDAVDGSVLVEFDIDPYGRSENITVVRSDPPGFKDDAAARSVRQSRFRPRIEDGEFVHARRQGYLISFRYVPDDSD